MISGRNLIKVDYQLDVRKIREEIEEATRDKFEEFRIARIKDYIKSKDYVLD